MKDYIGIKSTKQKLKTKTPDEMRLGLFFYEDGKSSIMSALYNEEQSGRKKQEKLTNPNKRLEVKLNIIK